MIHIIIDNWSAYKTKALGEFCKNNNIVLHYIPTGAPYFNRIESALFARLQDELLDGSNFKDVLELKKSTINWIDDRYNKNAYHKVSDLSWSN